VRFIAMLLFAVSAFCSSITLRAQQIRPADEAMMAPTPPMGWNSWDSYGLRINEQQFREHVEALATKLKRFGYTYASSMKAGT